MNKKRAIWLVGGATGAVAVGTALLALSVTANGVEPGARPAMQAVTPQHAEIRIQIAQADAAPVASPVSYASDQADRGEEEYDDSCVECHGDDLRGGLLGGPPLRGVAFEEKYANGSPAGVLFELMSATMPPNAPGRLSAETYTDLMAYILRRNGFAAGAPLPTDIDALYNMIIEK